jgi:ubiquinone/menaquinone biosynthesis C-methylase UbiE
MEDRKKRVKKLIEDKGILWTAIHIFKTQVKEKISDKYTIWNKKNELLTNDDKTIIDLPSHTVDENKRIWNNYDWEKKGEEWTVEVQKYKGMEPTKWKKNLIDEMMIKHIQKNSVILEIGPGGGRWSKELINLSKNLILADITQKCLDICQDQFKENNNIEYRLIEGNLDFIGSDSIDYVWSYDVFVHINPTDIEKYIKDFQRILKPGGVAIIHHSGTFSDYTDKNKGWRAFIGGKQFAHMVEKYQMSLTEQNIQLVHLQGDIISIFTKVK